MKRGSLTWATGSILPTTSPPRWNWRGESRKLIDIAHMILVAEKAVQLPAKG